MSKKARVIAFYLPQFHPVPVNDKYWGKGFTEWTNVAKAKPIYKGHYQPRIPADLGFYDLRIPEVREAQAKLAREAGVEGFCYWTYWFGNGEKVLEMPLAEVIKTKKPDFPLCIGWANHDWSNKTWEKSGRFHKDVVFLKQKYLGKEDYTAFFNYLLPVFKDKRYMTVDGKPIFYIYDPEAIPPEQEKLFVETFRTLAKQEGFKDMYFVGRADPMAHIVIGKQKEQLAEARKRYEDMLKRGYDAVNSVSFRRAEVLAEGVSKRIRMKIGKLITGSEKQMYDYGKIMDNYYMDEDKLDFVHPQLVPGKDRSPRSGKNARIYTDSTPEKFRKSVREAVELIKDKPLEKRLLFLNSWNEWGEGAYMEPDLKFGHGYLDALRAEIEDDD